MSQIQVGKHLPHAVRVFGDIPLKMQRGITNAKKCAALHSDI